MKRLNDCSLGTIYDDEPLSVNTFLALFISLGSSTIQLNAKHLLYSFFCALISLWADIIVVVAFICSNGVEILLYTIIFG